MSTAKQLANWNWPIGCLFTDTDTATSLNGVWSCLADLFQYSTRGGHSSGGLTTIPSPPSYLPSFLISSCLLSEEYKIILLYFILYGFSFYICHGKNSTYGEIIVSSQLFQHNSAHVHYTEWQFSSWEICDGF